MKSLLFKALSVLSVFCSIFGFAALFFADENKFLIAVVVYSIAITAFFIALFVLVCKSLSFKYNEKYKRIAALLTFSCDDKKKAVFENRKIIQSKTPFLSEVEYKRKWYGTGSPIFKVNGVPVAYSTNGKPDEYDIVPIKMGKILAYNETSSFSTSYETQFSDYEPFYGCRVEEPTDFIQFRILLGYKSGKVKPASLYKKSNKPGSTASEIFIENIDFDAKHKLYFKLIDDPEVGYDYFIKWQK